MGLRGSIEKIQDFKRSLREMPRTIAADVASRAAPALTDRTRQSFDAGQTVYGDARPAGVNGQALTLRKTGAASRELKFVAVGTIVRCVLGPDYAKYLIGKYSVLPNGAMPAAWSKALRELTASFKPKAGG